MIEYIAGGVWIASMVWMYRAGFLKGSTSTMDWLEEKGYISFDEDGTIQYLYYTPDDE